MTALTASRNALVANPWSLIPPLGHLDAYISAVNRMPMLTLEEEQDRKSTRLNSSHVSESRMPSSA